MTLNQTPSNRSLPRYNLPHYGFQIISEWVEYESKVLDLGCGDGKLLKHLIQKNNVSAYGIELNTPCIINCIENGVNVIQTNLDDGLDQFATQSFDSVILSLTLQAVQRPKQLLIEMMRVAKEGIITFPNFAYWKNRLQLLLRGQMPINKQLPYSWYDTPNIHLCTLKDFYILCDELGFAVVDSVTISKQVGNQPLLNVFPNLFGEIAICKFTKK